MKPLVINTKDKTKAKDNLDTYKQWFNGIKHFFTLKVLPPRQK